MRATVAVLSAMVVLIGIGCQSRTLPANALLNINGLVIDAEVAATREVQERGLMGRTFLDDGRGMLFVFPEPRVVCMWMRDTPIPLSVAFISADNQIVGIDDMQPNTDTSHCAPQPVRFVLEVPHDWFGKNRVTVGMSVDGFLI